MLSSEEWTVLLVDDEADIREVLGIILTDAGYKVLTAADGEAGLLACQKAEPQIVLTDIRMPKMDGIRLLTELKNKMPEVEVIVFTAFGEMELAIKALQLDASDFITKPINEQALTMALKRARERYTSRKWVHDYMDLLEEEKAATKQELIKTFAFQKNLIESSMDGIVGSDAEERVVTFNRSMEHMLGWPKEKVLQVLKLEALFAPGQLDRLKELLAGESLGGQGRLFLFETQLVSREGQMVPVQVSATKLTDQGRDQGLVCFFRDLRELRRLEREMADQASVLHQDKMMSLGRLAASVAHEINNPLAGILNYIRLMIRIIDQGALNGPRQEKFSGYLHLVETETKRCSRIVSNLLTFSRRSPEKVGLLNIKELIERCVVLSQHKMDMQNIKLHLDLPGELPQIEGDFNQIQQCVINLVFNGIDAMPQGGDLFIAVGHEPKQNLVTISVRDTGGGIAAEDLDHIFEPFYTTKKEGYGVGLGLSTVYGIMERHQGSVEVKTGPGQGSAFILKFPFP